MEPEIKPEIEPTQQKHWLDVAADLTVRMDKIEERQTRFGGRLVMLEGNGARKSISDDPMFTGLITIMLIGSAIQILVPLAERLMQKWFSSSQ